MRTPSPWPDSGFVPWSLPADAPHRTALVLSGGGATGIAWEAGLLMGLRDHGVDIRDADTVIGTSAGSVVGTHIRLETSEEEAFDRLTTGARLPRLGRLGLRDARRFARATMTPNRGRGRALIGRSALVARTASEEEWLDVIGYGISGMPWPPGRLLITAVDASSGASVVFHAGSGVPLDRAVAASCSVPGIFPPVTINGRRYVDGGLRSVSNADLAHGHDRVLVLAPIPMSTRWSDRPSRQIGRLRPQARTLLVTPDRPTRRVLGFNVFDIRRGAECFQAGRAQGWRISDRVGSLWVDRGP